MDNNQNELLHKADYWKLLSMCFAYPEDKVLDKVSNLAGELKNKTSGNTRRHSLLENLEDIKSTEEIQKDYSVFFVQGRLPLNESFCSSKLDAIADVSAFYNAFGLKSRSGDAPDSLSYELEFLSLLCLKAALADDQEKRDICESAYTEFLNDHMSEFQIKFVEKTKHIDLGSFYGKALELLELYVQEEFKQTMKLRVI